MAASVICGACGAKIKAGRTACMRCGEALLALRDEPGRTAPGEASRRRGPPVLAGSAVSLMFLLAAVWMFRGNEPPAAVARPAAAGVAPAATRSNLPPTQAPEPQTALDRSRVAGAAYAAGDFGGALVQF